MAKKVDLKAAKAAKQKKLAIGGAVLLLALGAFSVPKTLKMLHPAAPKVKHKHSLTANPTLVPTAPAGSTVPSIPVSGTPVASGVLTAQLAPAAREGQLSVLSASFKSKDPFKQLIDDSLNSTTNAPAPTTAKPGPTLKVVPTVQPAATPTTSATPAAAPAVVLPYLSAVISVNGVREGVDVKVDFPADAPVFHLVKVTKRTVKISVAGGSLADGKNTLTLRRGKPLTLVNTADGTRYRIVLVSTSTATAVAPVQATSTSPTDTTPTQTTTTPTTTTPTIGG
jgi:hypothetical protein